MNLPEQLLTPDDVAQWLGVKRKSVIDQTSRYEPIIPHLRMGKAIRVRREDVERFLSEQVTEKCTGPAKQWGSADTLRHFACGSAKPEIGGFCPLSRCGK